MPWVYIIETNLNKYYVGSTADLEKRLAHHQGGHTPTTKKFGFKKCVLTQEYPTLSEARKVEMKIKKFKRRDYIEKMIKEGYIRITP